MIKITLAPLAGVTDRAFRNICRCFGADFATTEMVSAKAVSYTHLDVYKRQVLTSRLILGKH